MEPEFDVERFEKKLLNLKDTQDSITGLSKWCLNKRTAHKQIVRSWLNVLKQVKIDARLTLFYLANDVIQHSKRRNYEFVDSWGTSLQKATTLVRDDKVKEKISRIFNIWEQREIYSEDFIADMHGLLAINPAKKTPSNTSVSSTRSHSPIVQPQPRIDEFEEEFQLSGVVLGIRNCVSLESETDKNLKIVLKTNVPEMQKTRSNLKDRTHVDEVERDLENATAKYGQFITSLNEEIAARKILLTALDQADRFYRNQRRDVKKVVYAYKNFGDRIKTIQTELTAKMPTLASPIPSPDINAPSPEPDNDFDLPGESNFYGNSMNGFGSSGFLGNNAPLPFDLNEFYRESPPPPVDQNSIQVIHSQDQQQSAPLNDFYNSLIPSKLEAYNPEMSFGSYQPQSQPPLPTGPPMSNYGNNSSHQAQPYMVAPPPPPVTYNPTQIEYAPQRNSGIPLPPPSRNQQNEDYSWNNWNSTPIETPNSPPSFERKGHDRNTIQYVDENLRTINPSSDIDHRQLMGGEGDIGCKDVDHRNLISLTGSPGQGGGPKDSDHRNMHSSNQMVPTNGNDQFLDPPPMFNKFMGMAESMDMLKPPMINFSPIRNQRPALLPTPSMPPRYNRNMSMNSDSSRGMNGPDDIESVDMEMSDPDDDTGMDNRSVGSSGDHREFSMPNMFSLPHQINMNRPPPPLMNEDMNQQRKSWIHNQIPNDGSLCDDGSMNQMSDAPPSLLGIAPPNFMPRNHQNSFPGAGGFRGGRGGKMIRGGANISPYNPNFRGGIRPRGRGGFRGSFKGQNPW